MTEELIEYRVKPVTRYAITRFKRGSSNPDGTLSSVSSVGTRGEFENADVAYEVAYALARADHERMGWPIDDPRIQYPHHPREAEVLLAALTPKAPPQG